MKRTIFLAALWFAVSCTRVTNANNEALPPKRPEPNTATPAATDPELNEWTSPMDGSQRYTLHFPSDESAEGSGDLLIRCSSREGVDAYVHFPRLVESSEKRSGVRIKFDDQPPFRQWWTESKNSEALFSPTPRQFVDQLTTHKTFLLEHEVFRGPQLITKFDISSARRVIPNLLSACGVTQREKSAKEKAAKRMAQEALWDSIMRKLLEPHITICKAEPFHSWGRWCYYDPAHAGSAAQLESAPLSTREEAMLRAIDHSKGGIAFCIESIKASNSANGDIWSACSDYVAAASGVIDLREGKTQ
jgi:hypothetical protein